MACTKIPLVVPQSSSLEPFPLDEKVYLNGNHSEIVRPTSYNDPIYRTLKHRLTRGAATAEEKEFIFGRSEAAIRMVAQIQAASELTDVEELLSIALESDLYDLTHSSEGGGRRLEEERCPPSSVLRPPYS